jgi:hypothetical protein
MHRALGFLACSLALSTAASAQTVDIVGSTANVAVTSNVAKGNSYDVTTSVHLTQAEFHLNYSGAQTLTFTVHEGVSEFGTYDEVFRSSAVVNGIGLGWYSSGAINVPLDAGKHYIVAVSWTGVMTYYFDTGDSQAVSFGEQTHGYAVGQNPLPMQFSSGVNDQAIYYQRLTTTPPGPVVTPYCTSGTTTHLCVPSIAGTGTPSASAGSGFTISVSDVEGQKAGVLFYGIDNSGFTPVAWGPSTSYLCIKSPTQRSLPQFSGGTLNQCDGTLSLDWNAFIAANPTALGNPFPSGQSVYAQGWFRDPPNPKHTMLSNGLFFTVGP